MPYTQGKLTSNGQRRASQHNHDHTTSEGVGSLRKVDPINSSVHYIWSQHKINITPDY